MKPDTFEPIGKKTRFTSMLAASSGNLVEWYDFYIYAFSATYFISSFSASNDPTIELIAAFGIFALGFFMRPIGSYLFGALGDKIGRKKSMVYSVLLMAISSLLIAILPTKDHVGNYAILLLLAVRILQGLSVGGEYGIAATYLSEIATKGNRGFYSSFQYVTLIGGQLIAVASLVILELIFQESTIKEWAWRLLFAFGGILALLSLLLRSDMHESGDEIYKHKDRGSFKALTQNWKYFLMVIGFTAGGSLAFYTFSTYTKVFMVNTAGIAQSTSNNIMLAALFFFMIFQPLFGALGDRIGRRTLLIIFSILAIISIYPIFHLLGKATSSIEIFFILIWAFIVLSLYTSVGGVIKAELFPIHVRALATGLSYAIGNAIFGGSASYVALKFKSAGMPEGFYIYCIVMFVICLIVAYFLPKRTYLE
ncbi:MFS transporter [Helicobacter sp. 11S02629-2]|uniref:MFS transporter n=1 Tax=Helicobacter sp. 11S02629-2 TaxID=1476195 RepID=UPI000BA5C139|nr:MFS transporter [Helicobacter sp. 11S02629-2]PAF44992.1 alpha-ketoglutarate permease [Helicobacter sp. 11S02629-2]